MHMNHASRVDELIINWVCRHALYANVVGQQFGQVNHGQRRIIVLTLILTTSLFSCGQTNQQTTMQTNYDSLQTVLETMVDKDQEIRRILVDSVGIDSPNAGPYIQQMMNIDADNQKNIRLILNKYGWIKQSKIGTKAAKAFFYIIQHSDTTLMIKWFPEFKKLADTGEADKVECAMMEDRLLMWRGKKQLYGTQASAFRDDKKIAIWPIEDPENVNERRKQIGFALTVEEYADRLKAIYNENEQLPSKSKR